MYLLKLTISSLQVLNFSVTSLTTVSCSHKQPTGSLPGWVRLSSCITSLINTITNISISTSINISISIATVRRWQPHRYPNLVWILLYVLSRWAIDIFLSVLFVHVSFAVWKIWGWWEKGLDLVGKGGGEGCQLPTFKKSVMSFHSYVAARLSLIHIKLQYIWCLPILSSVLQKLLGLQENHDGDDNENVRRQKS